MKKSFKAVCVMVVFGLILAGWSGPIQTSAQAAGRSDSLANPPKGDNPYYIETSVTAADGTALDKATINGPSTPPPGYEVERAAVALPEPNQTLGVNILTVPGYEWVYGCAAVSAAMIAGYYDYHGFTNMYAGPTNAGVAPMNSSSWSFWSDQTGDTYPNNPLVASHAGVDGLTTRGSIDDSWVSYGSDTSDPYITGNWAQHAWSGAVGDFMKTSQSFYGHPDGATSFYTLKDGQRLTCSEMESLGIAEEDGTYGRKKFYEARGYTVSDCYAQPTDNRISGGYSYSQYKAEIDAGHPVLINLKGHSIVGVGYDDTGSKVYIHDTWDQQNHVMTWGGRYMDMPLDSVSIVHLAPAQSFSKTIPANGATAVRTYTTLAWQASPTAARYEYCYDTTDDDACTTWLNAGSSLSVKVPGLKPSTAYYWQVRAVNISGVTYANGSPSAFWSFTTSNVADRLLLLPLIRR